MARRGDAVDVDTAADPGGVEGSMIIAACFSKTIEKGRNFLSEHVEYLECDVFRFVKTKLDRRDRIERIRIVLQKLKYARCILCLYAGNLFNDNFT